MENIGEYPDYLETNSFGYEDLNFNWATDQQSDLGHYNSNSMEGSSSKIANKNVVTERNRRKKLTNKLLALREAVPKISKLDNASILKDAIDYIQDLQEQERRLQAELMELESNRLKKDIGYDFDQELPVLLRSKKTRYDQRMDGNTCPIEVHELSVSSMGAKTLLVSLTCNKTTDTMSRICEVFESLKLKIISANLTTLSEIVKKTVLIEADEEDKEDLEIKIESAVSDLLTTYSSRWM